MGLDALDSTEIPGNVKFVRDDLYICIQGGCDKNGLHFDFENARKHVHTRQSTKSNDANTPVGLRFEYIDSYRCINPDCKDHNLNFNYKEAMTHVHSAKLIEIETLSATDASYRIPIKWRFDLIPPLVLRELAAIYEEGAKKYGPSKYIEKPLPFSVLLNHLTNHLNLYCSGDRTEKHLAKVLWGVATMMTLERLIEDHRLPINMYDLTAYGSGASEALQKRLDSSNESSV